MKIEFLCVFSFQENPCPAKSDSGDGFCSNAANPVSDCNNRQKNNTFNPEHNLLSVQFTKDPKSKYNIIGGEVIFNRILSIMVG